MSVILFLDMLGGKDRWRIGGPVASKEAFDVFTRLVIAAAKPDMEFITDGAIETDSAVIVCSETIAALRIAKRACAFAFRDPDGRDGFRSWLRGSIVPHEPSVELRSSRFASSPMNKLNIFTYSPSLFDAVSIEKAGFKGMRILMRQELVTANLRAEGKIPIRGFNFLPFKKLRYSSYPTSTNGPLVDFLWMATEDSEAWQQLLFGMAKRLRNSAQASEEFAQAAATQVVFHECDAMIMSIRHRSESVTRA